MSRQATAAFLVFAAGVTVLASQASRPDHGARLLSKLQNALGGAKQIAGIRDFEEVIRAEAWDSKGGSLGQVRKRTRWMRSPNVVRLDQLGFRGTYVLFYDGETGAGWEIPPDVASTDPFKTDGKPVPLKDGELKFARGYLSGFVLNQWLADRTPGYTVSSPRASVLRITHNGDATDFTLDPATGLPLKSASVSLADPDRPVPAEIRYSGWKLFSGVRFPSRRVNYHSGIKRGEVVTEMIQVNAGLDAGALGTKPRDFAPDIPRLPTAPRKLLSGPRPQRGGKPGIGPQ
jgi:hypothetical protein